MKKTIACMCSSAFVCLLTSGSLMAQITDSAPYCQAGYDDGFFPVERYVSKVSLGSLTNTSGTVQAPGAHYVYYNNLTIPELIKGNTYPLMIENDGGVSIHYVAVFIDFNGNEQFDLPDERVLIQSINTNDVTNPSTAQVTIPSDATEGVTRMRVMVFEDDEFTFGSADPVVDGCTAFDGGSFDWGETEDYNVKIVTTTAGTEHLEITEAFKVYPNPAKESIKVREQWKNAAIEVIGLDGRILINIPSVETDHIDISGLESGNVIFQITNHEGTRSQNLLIVK
ncbi:T9SS type A sorting domain-containing protein [Crocinitomicaceae bacterium CZZ-1]|uniref:T9SS type A sorting domain-containing protein n=1 Tax=Taishania pollutisoli TaxID=2766479 RepID=A0A8J6TRI3_9FLAO|nr:GEVED domain-containing protein [Taishania pollutisoli]MBC9811077.1 T9SS type A sorting domain-containing protein [Taishania pollutisoli]MBX2950233.1 T9SS type A sorting domain-containing protein [Crocinitomicaceae bacterium]NGF76714.1 T9SS type A sorting domain-containing protein [Fluviicola sp. SGL-29]